MCNDIRMHHECEGKIEKIRPKDRRFASRDFLSNPHTNDGFLLLLTTPQLFLFIMPPTLKKMKGHIALGLYVRPSIHASVRPSQL